MTGKKMVIKAEEITAKRSRRTMDDFGFQGSPATRVIPPAKGRGAKYNRAREKRRYRSSL